VSERYCSVVDTTRDTHGIVVNGRIFFMAIQLSGFILIIFY